jgi:hypothetical protein
MTKKETAEPIIVGAREFFEESESYESDWRDKWADDLRFRAGEQWPEEAVAARHVAGEAPRPCMTIDQTDQYARQVVNDARLSPPALRASPVDDKADIRVAEDLQGLFRHIERVSRAQRAYLTALDWAVTTGRGGFLVYSELINEQRNFYEPRIKSIPNALRMYLDPHSTSIDGSDQTDAMLVNDFAIGAFKRRWPGAEAVGSWDGGMRIDGWCTSDVIRVAEWHSVRERKRKAIMVGEEEWTEEEMRQRQAMSYTLIPFREIEVKEKVCTIRHVTAFDMLEETEFHAPHVGIIPVYGNDRYTDERRQVFGLIRGAKDAQRLTNYLVSNLAEAVNGQTKAPWVGPLAAFAGLENEWARANQGGKSYLPYNHKDPDLTEPIPAPTRNSVDLQLMGYQSLVQMGHQMLQTTLGMYQASVGGQSNETSGIAIARRKSESDVGTYHYIDNLADSIQHGGRIIMAMLPKVYDTARVARVLGEDGTPNQVRIDPKAGKAFEETQGPNGKMHVLNPTIGEYDIHVSVGPSYASQREETAATLAELYGRNPNLMAATGDIYFENLNFPGAKQIAKRMKAMLPNDVKAADEESDIPQEITDLLQRAQGAFEQREQMIAAAMQEAGKTIEEATQKKSQADVAVAKVQTAIANMQTERARLDKEAADLAHERALLAKDKAAAVKDVNAAVKDVRQAQTDMGRAFDDGARRVADSFPKDA